MALTTEVYVEVKNDYIVSLLMTLHTNDGGKDGGRGRGSRSESDREYEG